jgi:hypothetical protein
MTSVFTAHDMGVYESLVFASRCAPAASMKPMDWEGGPAATNNAARLATRTASAIVIFAPRARSLDNGNS